MTVINVISSSVASAPFGGLWESTFVGYALNSEGTPTGQVGSDSLVSGSLGYTFEYGGLTNVVGSPYFIMGVSAGAPQTFFARVDVQKGAVNASYLSTQASYYPTGTTSILGLTIPATTGPTWMWSDPNSDFTAAATTVLTFNMPAPSPPAGKGDITNPEAWEDANSNIPPAEYSNVPYNVNFPLNGDGRYWFSVKSGTTDTGSPIRFIGDSAFYTGTACLQWSVVQEATDGSGVLLAYTTDGATWTTNTLLPQTQLKGIQNGEINVVLGGATAFEFQVYTQGGITSASALPSQIAVAVTRNANEGLKWDSPNPFNPAGYNALIVDTVVPTDTLANLRARILIRLGFANQSTNPPPGMALLVNDFLTSAQKYLYKRYLQLHTKRMFRWKVNPGQRFYSLKDNDENVTEGAQLDPAKCIEWAGIQDTRNVWYPLIQGIPPQLYTMITKPWRPARYELRNAIELYPAPDQTYWLWVRGHFGLQSFTADGDITTVDSELVFLHALANAKAHYGQPDANNVESQANAYRAELVASTHQTAHYVPGTTAVPPAVRPTLIQFNGNS